MGEVRLRWTGDLAVRMDYREATGGTWGQPVGHCKQGATAREEEPWSCLRCNAGSVGKEEFKETEGQLSREGPVHRMQLSGVRVSACGFGGKHLSP